MYPKEAWLGSCPLRKAANSLNMFQPHVFLYLLLDQCSAVVMTRLWAAIVCLWLTVWRLLSQTQEAEWHVTDEHTHAHLQFRKVDEPEPAAAAAAAQLNSKIDFLSVIFFNECWLCCPCDHVSVCVERIDVRWPYFEQTSNVSPTRFIPLRLSFFHQKWILKISQNIFYEVWQIAKGRSEEQRSKAGSPNRKCVRQKNALSVKQWRRYE